MREFLVDTNVISELMKSVPNEHAVNWLCDNSDSVRISSITVKELYYGALRMDEGKRKASLLAKIDAVVGFYQSDVFDFDASSALACARMHALAVSLGRTPDVEDLMIAATAQVRGIPVATRNIKDFNYLGIEYVNPFDYKAETKTYF